MTEEQAKELYNILIDEGILTKEKLISNGFNEEEINQLLEEKILIIKSNGEYVLSSINGFYRYGVKLLLTQQTKRAYACFNICNRIDPTNRDVCLQLLYSEIRLEHFNSTFERFPYIETLEPDKYFQDNNLYLYMLSKITGLPEKYRSRISKLNGEDMLIPIETEYRNKDLENTIRINIMKNKYKYALNLLNNLLATDTTYSIHQSVLKELLIKVIYMEERFKSKLLELAQRKEYEDILSYLDNKANKRSLNHTERCIYLLVKSIINISRTKVLPPVTVPENINLYEAIKGNDYILAQDINVRFISSRGLDETKDIINILLTDINELIANIIAYSTPHQYSRKRQKTE